MASSNDDTDGTFPFAGARGPFADFVAMQGKVVRELFAGVMASGAGGSPAGKDADQTGAGPTMTSFSALIPDGMEAADLIEWTKASAEMQKL